VKFQRNKNKRKFYIVMAKVTGPLFSMTASGKLGNCMVHFPWKGLAVVREWLKPANPKTADQGDIRLILGGLGRGTRIIETTSLYKDDAIDVAGPQQTFVSALVKYVIDNWMKDGTEFEAEYTAYAAHAAKTDFDDEAAAKGLVDFDVSYKGTTHIFYAGMMLYELARYAIARQNAVEGAFNRSPYTIALADWVLANIQAMITDLEAV
jgi:hypothetical protein